MKVDIIPDDNWAPINYILCVADDVFMHFRSKFENIVNRVIFFGLR